MFVRYMTRPPLLWMFTLYVYGVLGCHSIAGIEDKQLDPSTGGSTDANVDVVQEASGDDAAPDVVGDSALDVEPDAGVDASPRYPRTPPDRPDGGLPEASDAALDAPADAADGGGKTLTFAARRIFFGSIDPDTDKRTFEAWRQFGYDIDGMCTTAKQSQDGASGVCKKPPGATALCQEDGDECRDNTVGRLVSDVLKFSATDFERAIHTRTISGQSQTLIIQLMDLGGGPDDPYVPARIWVSAPTKFPPLWDGTDVLPVDEDHVIGSADEPKHQIEHGYVRDHMWVSSDFNVSPALMPMMLFDEVAEVNMDTATLSVQLDAAHQKPLHGMLSAVLQLNDMEALLRRGVLEATNCNTELADKALAGYFLPGRDLASGSPNFVSPAVVCDRQSIGLMLELVKVEPPQEAVKVEPQPSACE